MVSRRIVLSLLVLSSPVVAYAHTPYRLWDAFRKRNLQVLTSREDYAGDEVGEAWVAVLRDQLPLSRAMVSRARDLVRVASLLKTDQSKIAVLSHEHARQMFNGEGAFAPFLPMPLELLLDDGAYVLVARNSLPKEHGFFITAALAQSPELGFRNPTMSSFGMEVHPGAQAFFRGEEMKVEPKAES
jgi:hypothetical protein